MSDIRKQAYKAKEASRNLACLSTAVKDAALEAMAAALEENIDQILKENGKDVEAAAAAGRPKALIDRLMLNQERIKSMAEGLRQIRALADPVGEIVSGWTRPNGLEISQRRVPLGVVGIIYEARPNVTADAAGLCIKTANAVVLKGGSEAINSNQAIVDILCKAAYGAGIPEGAIQFISSTDRSSVIELIGLNGIVDVVIPRGGAGLIKAVVENAKVPVIETGVGNCHVYIDGECDFQMALDIIVNAKTQRPGVCNAAETLLIDRRIAGKLLPLIAEKLQKHGVELRGDEESRQILKDITPAVEEDWYTEYLDLIMAVKVVGGVDEAIAHITKYGTGHSEAIVTANYHNGRKFIREVDAAAVYLNASTRFTDGFEYGFGAEIGISTQKLHARGPMGLKELTTIKYIVTGNGHVR
jgi:glutamate-5-semialdehyde dehydrogenase